MSEIRAKVWSDGTPFTIQREGSYIIIKTPRNGGNLRTSEFAIVAKNGDEVLESYPLIQQGVGGTIEDALTLEGIILSANREEAIIDIIQNNGRETDSLGFGRGLYYRHLWG